ncbi:MULTISPECIES: ScbR family autoregulator-binding transcription factor [unclassified Streptomyces]|uniref:ScbR family autoregulator-binding transcription factor n=1 Tax=unclassified Streptomyces TaxID=2593676 RepID=UPI0020363544|nr:MULTISPECIES: ScbR family autoregulator-binding transcription factor [unclassified Streptomyces]
MVKQERAVRTREALIRSAAEIFDRDGFTMASLTTISRQAGVSNGALHFHFASKAALADAVEDTALARLRIVAEGRQPGGGGFLQHVVDVTHGLARGLAGDVVLRAGFELSSRHSRPPRTDLRAHWQQCIEQALERAGERGELRPGVTPAAAAAAVVAATVGFEVLSGRNATWLSPQTVSEFWRLLLPGLASGEVLAALKAEGS